MTKLAELEKGINVTKFNAMLCALISNPEFVQAITENAGRLIQDVKNMSQDDMYIFTEILNYVDLPLKND